MNAPIASADRLKQRRPDFHFFDVEAIGVRYAFHLAIEQPRDACIRRQVAQSLRSLHRQMLKHFEREEDRASLWHDDEMDVAQSAQWKRLFDEHPLLLERLGAIITAVENFEWKSAWVVPSLREFDKLVGALLEHETRENSLLQNSSSEA